MDQPPPSSNLPGRVFHSGAVLLGIGLGFLTCCLAGFLASRNSTVHPFTRFHLFLSPETHYYPTVSQTRRIARDRAEPDKILVVIGGSSRLHGTGQAPDQVWTDKLQAVLGDDYRVINFGFRGAWTAEFGAVAAEVLSGDYRKLILVTDLYPGYMLTTPDGRRFKYFFWDAYYKGLLLPHPAREARLRELLEQHSNREAIEHDLVDREETRRAMWLDSVVSFHELWNSVAYRHRFTVWTGPTRDNFTMARRRYRDPERGSLPLETRYQAEDGVTLMQNIRATFAGLCVKGPQGQWVEQSNHPGWAKFDRAADTSFPPAVRPRTLMLLTWFSPHYLDQLSAEERSCYATVSQVTREHLEKLGLAAQEVGPGLLASDYADHTHFAEPGGAKLAVIVASRVREMAQRLGYTTSPALPSLAHRSREVSRP
jgi:hypothetical protein